MLNRQSSDFPAPTPVGSVLAGSRLAPASLSSEERRSLETAALPSHAWRVGAELVREGDEVDRLYVIAGGWACRYQTTRDGNRQIVELLLPGDVANLGSLTPGRSDFGVRALSPLKAIALPTDRVIGLAAQHPGIAMVLVRLTLADNAILSRWALCLGRKSAEQRLAHLFCELGLRLAGNGSDPVTFDLPLTQEQIADALGLTSVHVNRTMQHLRGEGLVTSVSRSLTIPDVPRLRALAEFDPSYLRG